MPFESSAEETVDKSMLARGKAAWVRGKDAIVSRTDEAVLFTGRKMGLRPEEEKDALLLSKKVGKVGAGAGGFCASVWASAACSPGIATNAGYVACVGTIGTVGTVGGYFVGSLGGGFASLAWTRTKEMLGKLSIYPENKPEEE